MGDTHLCPKFQHVLEAHAGVCKFTLQQHDDIVIVFVNLLAFWRGRVALCVALFDITLESGYLLVNVGNVLFDNKSEFLNWQSDKSIIWLAEVDHTLISTGRSSKSVFRLATGKLSAHKRVIHRKFTHIALVCQASDWHC